MLLSYDIEGVGMWQLLYGSCTAIATEVAGLSNSLSLMLAVNC
jgi:hypothetical protein